VRVQQRHHAAVRRADDDPRRRGAEPLERRVELADLVPGRERRRAQAAPAEASAVVRHDRGPRPSRQHGTHPGPASDVVAAARLHHDGDRLGSAMHDEVHSVPADVDQRVLHHGR
jgi:hypothetical protein